jgi:hypothetical protein
MLPLDREYTATTSKPGTNWLFPITTSGVAAVCGWVPFLTGVSIFLLWYFTRWEWLIGAGVLTIIGGLAMFVVGSGALLVSFLHELMSPQVVRQGSWSAGVGVLLLFCNFPVALGLMAAYDHIEFGYEIVVQNHSQTTLENVQIHGLLLGRIPVGASAEGKIRPLGDSPLQLTAEQGERNISVTVEGYATRGSKGEFRIIVDNEGRVTILADNLRERVVEPKH